VQEPVLLYDGLCGFCNGLVQFALKWDRMGTMQFAPLQGVFAREVLARHPRLVGADSLVMVELPGESGERVRVRSDAAIAVAEYLGGAWGYVAALRVIPRALRDFVYDRFADARYAVFGRLSACPVPTAEQRARFID